MKKELIIGLLIVALGAAESAAYAGSGAEFPGKGSKKDWMRAAKTYDQALSQRKRGNVDAAMKLYEEAISIYPYDADFYYNLSIHYARDKKNSERAEELIKKAIELKPERYDLQWEYAAQLLAQGKLDAGKEVLLKAEKLKKTDAQQTELKETLKKIEDAQKS